MNEYCGTTAWSFTATPSTYLYNTSLPLPAKAAGLHVPKSTHNAQYWARVTKGMDFSDADRVDPAVYNRILWKGMMGNRPYPAAPTGLDLRQNRKDLLANYRRSLKQEAAQKPKAVTNRARHKNPTRPVVIVSPLPGLKKSFQPALFPSRHAGPWATLFRPPKRAFGCVSRQVDAYGGRPWGRGG